MDSAYRVDIDPETLDQAQLELEGIVEQQEQRRIEAMYGLSAGGAVAAGQATQMANQQYQSSMGNLLGAVGNLYQSGAFSGGGSGGGTTTSPYSNTNQYQFSDGSDIMAV